MQDAAGLVTLVLQPPLRAVHTVCAGPGKSSWLVCSPASAHPASLPWTCTAAESDHIPGARGPSGCLW